MREQKKGLAWDFYCYAGVGGAGLWGPMGIHGLTGFESPTNIKEEAVSFLIHCPGSKAHGEEAEVRLDVSSPTSKDGSRFFIAHPK